MLTVAGILAWTLRYPNGGMLNVFIKPVENSTKPAFELYLSTDELMRDALRIVLGQIPRMQTLRALPEGLGGGEAGVKAASQRPNREHYFIWVPVAVFLFISVCTLIFLIALCVSSYKFHRSGVRKGGYTASRVNTHRCVQLVLALCFAGLLVMTVLYFIGAAYLVIFLTEEAPQDQVDCLTPENLRLLPGLSCGMKTLESYVNNTIGDFGDVITEATDHIINTTNDTFWRLYTAASSDMVNTDILGDELQMRTNDTDAILNSMLSRETIMEEMRKRASDDLKKLSAVVNSLRDGLDDILDTLHLEQYYDAFANQRNALQPYLSIGGEYFKKYAAIPLFSLGGLFCLLALPGFVGCLWLNVDSSQRRIHRSHKTYAADGIRCCRGRMCDKFSMGCCSLLLIPVYLILLVLVVTLMFSGSLLATEGCHYLTKTGGFEKADYIANTYIEALWLNQTAGLRNSFGDLRDYIQLPPPQNVLAALNDGCDPKNVLSNRPGLGTMGAVGWKSLINVTGLLGSPRLQGAINNSESFLMDEFDKYSQGFTGYVDISPFDTWSENLKDFYNDKDQQDGFCSFCLKLTHRVLPIADGRALLESMTDVVTKVESLLTKPLGASVVSDLSNAVQSLNASKDAYQRVFEIVDARYISTKAALDPRAVNQSINDLSANINASLQTLTDGTLKSVLLQSYKSAVGRIQTRLEEEVGKIIADTTQTSFPCDKASYAWKAVTGVVCGSSGVVQQLFGLGLLIALETLFLCFFYTSLFYFSHVHSSVVA
ncbi:hypothetical protein SprV_0802542400 [Sparganum proliferum]